MSAVCYCDDCQKGARQIEALPNAGAVADPDGGTPYILYRKDRFACTKGADLLKSYKLKQTSATNRVVATCCNSAMFVNFDRGPFWVTAYRARFHGDLPPLQLRICTKFKPNLRRASPRRAERRGLSAPHGRETSRVARGDVHGTITGRVGSRFQVRAELNATANYLKTHRWQRGAGCRPREPNFAAILAWNAATIYEETIAIVGKEIDGGMIKSSFQKAMYSHRSAEGYSSDVSSSCIGL